MSFFEFLDLHYGWGKNAEEHDKKEPHDGQFPFHGTIVFHQIVLDSPCNNETDIAAFRAYVSELLVPNTLGSVSDFPRVVFQPPKA